MLRKWGDILILVAGFLVELVGYDAVSKVARCETAVQVKEDAVGAVGDGVELNRGTKRVEGGGERVCICERHKAADVVNISTV